MKHPILVADIGGTNARFALAQVEDEQISITAPQTFRAEDFETVRDAADAYLEAVDTQPDAACFAVAGPVNEDEITFTNSPWSFSISRTRSELKLMHFHVANDFEALAAGIAHLPPDYLCAVRSGTANRAAPKLVIGPGTGLGQALLVPTPQGGIIIPTEGGHVSFAPRCDLEVEVMRFIAREHPRVSVERLLCGRGLINLHRALCHIADVPRVSLQADEITKAALDAHKKGGADTPIAVQAVDMFCSLLGAVVGDAVLCTGARGGVVLGGGILPKIKDVFLASAFEDHLLNKGRMRAYIEPIPVDLITRDGGALYGAAALLLAQMKAIA